MCTLWAVESGGWHIRYIWLDRYTKSYKVKKCLHGCVGWSVSRKLPQHIAYSRFILVFLSWWNTNRQVLNKAQGKKCEWSDYSLTCCKTVVNIRKRSEHLLYSSLTYCTGKPCIVFLPNDYVLRTSCCDKFQIMWLNCRLGHNLSDHMTNTAFLALFHFTVMQSQSSQVLIWLVYNFVMLTVILLKPAKTDPGL